MTTVEVSGNQTQELVRRVLEVIKQRRGLKTDKQLADLLGVPYIYLWRWRNGDYGEAAMRVLVPYFVECADDLRPAA